MTLALAAITFSCLGCILRLLAFAARRSSSMPSLGRTLLLLSCYILALQQASGCCCTATNC
jgi:hypothetical protein